ncbi:MAG TPA: hypothetical protein VFX50_07390, partial [Gemmatimonadales bacterium]|nr:hypothetical protein [Gemmatimonadales bacterium]
GGAVGTTPSMPDGLRFHAAAILWRAGLADSAERVFTRTLAAWDGEPPWVSLLDAAAARAVRGDLDSSLALVARAVRMNPGITEQLETQPRFQALRGQPGLADALRGIPPSEATPSAGR